MGVCEASTSDNDAVAVTVPSDKIVAASNVTESTIGAVFMTVVVADIGIPLSIASFGVTEHSITDPTTKVSVNVSELSD